MAASLQDHLPFPLFPPPLISREGGKGARCHVLRKLPRAALDKMHNRARGLGRGSRVWACHVERTGREEVQDTAAMTEIPIPLMS